jgi:hypothetical protein
VIIFFNQMLKVTFRSEVWRVTGLWTERFHIALFLISAIEERIPVGKMLSFKVALQMRVTPAKWSVDRQLRI